MNYVKIWILLLFINAFFNTCSIPSLILIRNYTDRLLTFYIRYKELSTIDHNSLEANGDTVIISNQIRKKYLVITNIIFHNDLIKSYDSIVVPAKTKKYYGYCLNCFFRNYSLLVDEIRICSPKDTIIIAGQQKLSKMLQNKKMRKGVLFKNIVVLGIKQSRHNELYIANLKRN